MISNCDDKDLLGKWFDKASLESLEEASDEIVDEWLRFVHPLLRIPINSETKLKHTGIHFRFQS